MRISRYRFIAVATYFGRTVSLFLIFVGSVCRAEVPQELRPWLGEQKWQRDTDGPVVSLGNTGEFDDMHIFAPSVARENGGFRLWYCGSRGKVTERVFRLGLAASDDGLRFVKHASNPVFEMDKSKRSVLTPTLLRAPNGSVLREDGKLRMWFSSTDFHDESSRHTLHETTSEDGIHWSRASEVRLDNIYAPTVIKIDRVYQMWYTDVSQEPWVIRHASSEDGRRWRVLPEPALKIDQTWEKDRLFYPTVLKIDGAYLMWYGSYWTKRADSTALGFAVSLDGARWLKHPQNPVLRPDPKRPWESNYVTSQSIMHFSDDSFRIWYAGRKKPPFVNKYYSINTARWSGPESRPEPSDSNELKQFERTTSD